MHNLSASWLYNKIIIRNFAKCAKPVAVLATIHASVIGVGAQTEESGVLKSVQRML